MRAHLSTGQEADSAARWRPLALQKCGRQPALQPLGQLQQPPPIPLSLTAPSLTPTSLAESVKPTKRALILSTRMMGSGLGIQ